MSDSGDPGTNAATPRVEDVERALVLAREVAAATAKGGAANLRMEHLNALFTNGNGPAPPARIQSALEAAGLTVSPPLGEAPEAVSLRIDRGRAVLSSAREPARPARRANGRGVPLDELVSLPRRELLQVARLEVLVAVEHEDGKHAAGQLRPNDRGPSEPVPVGVALLADDDDLVTRARVLARKRPCVDVRPRPVEQVSVPDDDPQRAPAILSRGSMP